MVNKLFWLLLVSVLMFSCRTAKQVVTEKDIPLMTEHKLLKQIESNRLNDSTLFAKRIEVSFTDGENSDNFKASLKISRDSFMQISLTAPLGIEVARILLTQDSIKFVDVYHKKYFLADYDYFNQRYDVSLTYDFLQNIFTNTFSDFTLLDESNLRTKRYKLDRTEMGYKLWTVDKKNAGKKLKKFYKQSGSERDEIILLQEILIDPTYFRPLSMSLKDLNEGVGISVRYENFVRFGEELFPEKMRFTLFSKKSNMDLNLKFQRMEFNVPVEPNFRILSKYKRMEL
ncbi:MAG TPA: DUF4292 domain-containing protein [Candidatus Odoribacter faecigallinarum]|uniref:DUF4292 domain-containing protein n=1 Tax=Candidatus Odoribacter faecigallinarum TaxID=2838706 RepID=A0A9D1UYT2_9BACT|nr:DUF4292 domain-containing protein [Candidatus Odoribacter faecigallinarum]